MPSNAVTSTAPAPGGRATARTAAPPRPRPGAFFRLYRSELRLLFGRRRTQALLVVLCLAPVLLGTAVRLSSNGAGGGPAFISRIAGNGLYLAVAGLIALLPLLIPLAVSVVSADSVSGEASAGTLRYLLTVPVGRGRLLLVKYLSSLTFCLVLALAVAATGVVVGALLFPVGDITLLPGTTVAFSAGLLRVLLVAAYVTVSLTGLVGLGLLVSTLTEVPVGAMAATAVVPVVSEILDSVPQLSWLHPFLLTHHWFDLGDLLRDPVPTGRLLSGLLVQVGWVAVCGALAWARFTTRDVTT